MGKVYITGDKHARFHDVFSYVERNLLSPGDCLIVLGDAGINYYGDGRDKHIKKKLEQTGLTFMLVRGNHEARPIGDAYETVFIHDDLYEGYFIVDPTYPHILYLMDGETYQIKDKNDVMRTVAVIGGAYSVDKFYRFDMQLLGLKDYHWFSDEQLSKEEMAQVYNKLRDKTFDFVCTHTCPYSVRPVDMFLSGIDQATVDESTEKFLQMVSENIQFKLWYLGHWHTDRMSGPYRFMYNDIIELGDVY